MWEEITAWGADIATKYKDRRTLMLTRDYHMHSISPDANVPMEEMCRYALQKGIQEVAFTDHYEFYEKAPEKSYFQKEYLARYFREVQECEKRFQGRLVIKKGMEFGQLHLGGKEAKEIIENYPFDYIIGSLHKIGDVDLAKFRITEENAYDIAKGYYQNLLAVSEIGDFDCLGHLDYCKRHLIGAGFPDFYQDFEEEIKKILQNVIKRGKGIEVNTSGLRQAQKELTPAFRTLALYRELGGTVITVGSDAHKGEDVGYGFSAAEKELKNAGFKAIAVFKERSYTLKCI